MKNKYLNLKNALISATVAVFTGVLLLGVNAALGEAPTYDPPGAGVSPTFSGLTVDAGGITFYNANGESAGILSGGTYQETPSVFMNGLFRVVGILSVSQSIDAPSISNASGDFQINDTLDVTGSISDSNSDVTINDSLTVVSKATFNGAMNITNAISDGTIDDANHLIINDFVDIARKLLVTGEVESNSLNVNGESNLEGKIYNGSNASNGFVVIDDILQVNNRSILQKGVEANDGLTVSTSPLVANSNIEAKGGISNPTTVPSGGISPPIGQPVNINDPQGVYVTGSLSADGGISTIAQMVIGGFLTVSDYVVFDDDLQVYGDISDPGANSAPVTIADNLDVNGNLSATKNATITGNLTVSGNVNLSYQMASAAFNENTTGYKTVTANCPNGKKILACSIYFTDVNALYLKRPQFFHDGI